MTPVLLLLVAFFAISSSDLTFCNKVGYTISCSIGFHKWDSWASKGWYKINSGNCSNVITGNLDYPYYYAYAKSDGGHTWDGPNDMCTTPKNFYIYGYQNCTSRGFYTNGFLEIYTEGNVSYTLDFVDTLEGSKEGVNGKAILSK
eukprot:TRINITY_DN10029_c1_g1_i3.p1 TRINITY_DN10029_c1_g1~~TRINITY_DN10029_c1_g1_i3.p1  ORF type:complete len:145 (-),score=21.93 TRINITY_DN10029_c1_g1_i3:59-493(-)